MRAPVYAPRRDKRTRERRGERGIAFRKSIIRIERGRRERGSLTRAIRVILLSAGLSGGPVYFEKAEERIYVSGLPTYCSRDDP